MCLARNRPFDNEHWQELQAQRLGLLHPLRKERRPKAIQGTPNGINKLRHSCNLPRFNLVDGVRGVRQLGAERAFILRRQPSGNSVVNDCR
jgi:hypothetical protein